MRDRRLRDGKAPANIARVYGMVNCNRGRAGKREYPAVAGVKVVQQGLSIGGQGEPDEVPTAKADLSRRLRSSPARQQRFAGRG